MGYIYLAIAIVSEVIATTALKSSMSFTRLVPSLIVVVGYSIAFYTLSLTLKTITVGVAYAIWAGLGIVLIAILGMIVHHETIDLPGVLGMTLIVTGVVVLQAFSKTTTH